MPVNQVLTKTETTHMERKKLFFNIEVKKKNIQLLTENYILKISGTQNVIEWNFF